MGTHPKPRERQHAVEMRKAGVPMKQIAERLAVSVSSVSLWTRDIPLSEEQRQRNLQAAGRLRGANWRELNRKRRLGYQAEGRAWARMGDSLHEAGCMLYWAEGSKERNTLVFANSDANMMRFFSAFVISCFHVPRESFGLRLNFYTGNGLETESIESHWLDLLDLPRNCLRKHMVNHFPTSSSGKKKNKLPYGVATLSLGSTRIVQHIFGAIQEYGGFEEPRWLD